MGSQWKRGGVFTCRGKVSKVVVFWREATRKTQLACILHSRILVVEFFALRRFSNEDTLKKARTQPFEYFIAVRLNNARLSIKRPAVIGSEFTKRGGRIVLNVKITPSTFCPSCEAVARGYHSPSHCFPLFSSRRRAEVEWLHECRTNFFSPNLEGNVRSLSPRTCHCCVVLCRITLVNWHNWNSPRIMTSWSVYPHGSADGHLSWESRLKLPLHRCSGS